MDSPRDKKKHWPTQHLHLVWFSIWSHLWPLRFWASDYELMGQDPNQDICVHHCLQLVFSHFLSAGSSYFSGGNQRWFQVLHSFQSSSKCQYSLASSLQSLRKISSTFPWKGPEPCSQVMNWVWLQNGVHVIIFIQKTGAQPHDPYLQEQFLLMQ